MNKYLFLSVLSGFLSFSCSSDDVTSSPEPQPPVEKNSLYIVPDRLADYYEDLDLKIEKEDLYEKLAVHTISKYTTFLSYGQRHDYLYDADQDLNNPENVILVYSGDSRDKREYQSPNNPHTTQTFNTEHIYPQSKLVEAAKSDLHILRTVDQKINGQRSNHPYTDGEGQYKLIGGDKFYPGDEWKGDVARMIMYMNLYYNEPFDEVGSLELFLEWNAEDPVSYFEIQRNEVIERAQGNRNPFIDNPHFATAIWGGEEAANRWDGENETEDNEAPTAPTDLSVTDSSFTSISLSWDAASDNEKVVKYNVLVDGEFFASITSTSFTVTELEPGINYSFSITASDAAGNTSNESEAVEATTLADDEAPSIPQNLSVTSFTATSISLSWEVSTDNAGVQAYDIFLNGEPYSSVNTTSYTIAGLTPETTYSVSVAARDIFDNLSAQTPAIEVLTPEQSENNNNNDALILSEYLEGAFGFNKALEIANISNETVDLTSYSLRKITNANENWDNEYQLSGVLEAGDVFVIVNSKADYEGIFDAADDKTEHQIVNFNGNDPIGLFKNGELLDIIGNIGGEDFAKDVNLRRKTTVTGPNPSYTPDEWEEYPDTETSGLGVY